MREAKDSTWISFVDGQEEVPCAVFGSDKESAGKIGVDGVPSKLG